MSRLDEARGAILDEVRIDAPPETVWSCLTENSRIEGWFPDRAEGTVAPGETLRWTFEGFHEAEYGVKEVEEGQRLILENVVPGVGSNFLEFTLEPDAAGTRLRFEHAPMPLDEAFADMIGGMVSGWTMAFRGLKFYVETHLGEERTRVMQMRPATFEYEALQPYFRDAAPLSRWLTESGEIGAEGSPVALALRDGGPVTGRVLARTQREVQASWDERAATLSLKAFSGPPGAPRHVALEVSAYGLDPSDRPGLEADLDAALERLVGCL